MWAGQVLVAKERYERQAECLHGDALLASAFSSYAGVVLPHSVWLRLSVGLCRLCRLCRLGGFSVRSVCMCAACSANSSVRCCCIDDVGSSGVQHERTDGVEV